MRYVELVDLRKIEQKEGQIPEVNLMKLELKYKE